MNAKATDLKLYGYWRSSATWRIRWALELKKIAYTNISINLLEAENEKPEFLQVNPSGRVPVLVINDKDKLFQSMAIVEWIEENFPKVGTALLPEDPLSRAHVRSLAQIINADTAPLQIPLVQKAHTDNPKERKEWAQFFIRRGLKNFSDSRLTDSAYSFGDKISLADLFLIPQMYNALRYEIDIDQEFVNLAKIYRKALLLPECIAASPEKQADALA